MIFTETRLAGAYVIEPQLLEDERGFFSRVWCRREFAAHGLSTEIAQANLSYNRLRGTLRGLHYQVSPHAEVKLVRCTRGSILDVIVDLRPDSATAGEWIGVELGAATHRLLYVPAGFAHGFQTLEDHTEVTYQVSEFYSPEAERGLRYDDPGLGIAWPLEVTSISAKDRSWPPYRLAGGRPAR